MTALMAFAHLLLSESLPLNRFLPGAIPGSDQPVLSLSSDPSVTNTISPVDQAALI